MNALHVTAYLDGRPGHEKQTLAVVRALERLTRVALTIRTLGTHGTTHLATQDSHLSKALQGAKPESARRQPAVDLLIGSGRRTHLPVLLAKLRSGGRARAICCMTPPPALRLFFDLCLIPHHDRPPLKKNIMPTLGPPCLPENLHRHQPDRALILLGGLDPKSHYWDQEEIMGQIKALLTGQPDRRWTIGTSPRTPSATADALARLLSDLGASKQRQAAAAGENLAPPPAAGNRKPIAFAPAADTPPGWVEEQYAINREVWVTADSVSMVYEALSAGCRVGILPVRWRRPDNKFQYGLDELQRRGLTLPFAAWQAGASWPPSAPELNEAARCGREILDRWWPERLQE